EFGRLADGTIILADEISGDTARLWDLGSGEKLDKDRFRRDLGGVEEAYQEVHRRVLAAREPEPARPTNAHATSAAGHRPEYDHADSLDQDNASEDGLVHHEVVNVMLKRSILDPQG